MAGSYGKGIFLIEGNKICNVREKNGLSSDFISSIFLLKRKELWLGSVRGIIKIRYNDLKGFCNKEVPFVRSFLYNIDDGMKSEECSLWSKDSAFYDGKCL